MASALDDCLLSSEEEETDEEQENGSSGLKHESEAEGDDSDESSSASTSKNPFDDAEEGTLNKEDFDAEDAQMQMNLQGMNQAEITGPDEMAKSFADLGLQRWLCSQLKELCLKSPTPVQANCIPRILSGLDVIGCAKTGTGKTLAFALPILNQLAIDPYGVFALIITPTRELAFQIGDQFNALGSSIGLKTAIIVGGRDRIAQANDLSRKPHIVIATPGRLADHIDSDPNETGASFSKIKFLVLDEADRILEGQYADSLKSIFKVLPRKRQTLLFSATITSALSHLHQVSVKKPYFFEDKSEIATVERLDQKYVLCPSAVKDAYLVYVVKVFHERYPNSSILIFSHTCRECQALAIMFNGLGFQVGSLHSQILQRDRLSALTRFRSGKIRILVCTDVAARGLDIQHVDLVINHNVPRHPKTYVHRVGRSARAGRFGGAITFVTQYDISLLQEVEKLVGKKLDKLIVSDNKVKQYVTQVLVTKREAEIKLEQQNFGERKEINKRKELILSGLDPQDVEAKLKAEREIRTQKRKNKKNKQLETKKRKKQDLSNSEKGTSM